MEGVFEEGPLVIAYSLMSLTPTWWVARGVVLRGVPDGSHLDRNPHFIGQGSTDVEAMRALRGALSSYLDDPFWRECPCR
jgi:hypothetical protein